MSPYLPSVVRKMAQYMADILDPEDKDKLHENLLVGPNKVPMETFLIRFQWDGAKFPLRQPIPNIVEGISKVHVPIHCYMVKIDTLSFFSLWNQFYSEVVSWTIFERQKWFPYELVHVYPCSDFFHLTEYDPCWCSTPLWTGFGRVRLNLEIWSQCFESHRENSTLTVTDLHKLSLSYSHMGICPHSTMKIAPFFLWIDHVFILSIFLSACISNWYRPQTEVSNIQHLKNQPPSYWEKNCVSKFETHLVVCCIKLQNVGHGQSLVVLRRLTIRLKRGTLHQHI